MMNAMRSNYKCDDIALRCKHYLKKKDMTKKEFAATLGISQQALSALLNGKSSTGTAAYKNAMKYLKTRMRLADCTDGSLAIDYDKRTGHQEVWEFCGTD